MRKLENISTIIRVYEELQKHNGNENAISAKVLAAKFDIDERTLREIIHTIRNSLEFEKVIGSSNNGYFVCTKDEVEKSIRRLFNQAVNTIKVARAMEKKAGLNGQIKLNLGEYFSDTYNSLGDRE